MKILRVLPSMDIGGIERGVYDFALSAKGMGHTVIIASGGGRFIPHVQEHRITWHNVPMDRKTPAILLNSYFRLKQIIKKEQPDIVHAESRLPCWIAHSAMKSFPRIPWVTSIHNFHKTGPYSSSVGKGDLVVAVSETLKKYAVRTLKIPEEKIRVVYNGIGDTFLDVKKMPSYGFTAGMIARFTAWKGHFFFLKAIEILRKQGLDVKALIVGTGSESYRSELEKWILQNGMEGSVKIVTMQAFEALDRMDVLVVPSLEPEGFGRTAAEAQMSKVPVIGTNIGALPELIEEGRTGFLVEPGNAEQLAYKIRFVLQNPDVVSAVVSAARESAVRNFSVTHITQRLLGVYRELL